MTNAAFAASDATFRLACKLANVEPTRRQASKFRRDTGIAYRALRFARNQRADLTNMEDVADLESRLEFSGLRRIA